MSVFIPTLNQMGYLFTLILIGFFLAKARIIPENSSTVLAKFENVLFVPALTMGTFIKNFTLEKLSAYITALSVSIIIMAVMLPVALLLPKICTKDAYVRKIYTYGLEFSNFGFMGNAVVSAVFPDIFAEYLIFTIPLYTLIYVWAVPTLLIPAENGKNGIGSKLKNLLNPMFVAMLIGMVLGIISIPIPSFVMSVIDVAGSCMSPVAMLLTGVTVASMNFKKTFTDISIYFVSAVRLLIIPLVFIGVFAILPFELSDAVIICSVCSLAMPLGLNTIVVPSAYGKDTSAATGMAIISHLLSCGTIPVIFLIMTNVLL